MPESQRPTTNAFADFADNADVALREWRHWQAYAEFLEGEIQRLRTRLLECACDEDE